MSAVTSKIVTARAKFASQFPIKDKPVPEGEQPKLPDLKANTNLLAEKMKLSVNMNNSLGVPHTIDVIPDARHSVRAICFNLLQVYSRLEFRDQRYVTPPSLAGYSLELVYAFLALQDLHMRYEPSIYAAQCDNHIRYRQQLDRYLNCAVPDFVVDIITGLSAFVDPAHPHLEIIGTLAGYIPQKDLTRLPPPSLFYAAHNLLATMPTNTHPGELTERWFRSPLLKLSMTNTSYYVGQYVGGLYDFINNGNHETYVYENWFNEYLFQIFNPVVSRYHAGRPIFAQVDTPTPTFLNIDQINPIMFMLNMTLAHQSTKDNALNEISAFVASNMNGSTTLGQLLHSVNSGAILNHFLHEPILATHHTDTIATWEQLDEAERKKSPPGNYRGNYQSWKRATHTEIAVHQKFCPPNKDQVTEPPTKLNYVETTTGTPPVTNFNSSLYLVKKDNATAKKMIPDPEDPGKEKEITYYVDPTTYVEFDVTRHYQPDVAIHLPYHGENSSAYFSMIAGLLIESAEIDATSVPTINPRTALYLENTAFMHSLVAAGNVRDWLANGELRYQDRAVPAIERVRSAHQLYDFTETRLGRFSRNILDAAPVHLNPFKIVDGILRIQDLFSTFGYSQPADRSQTAVSDLRGKTLPLWSSYRYVSQRSDRTLFDGRYPTWEQNPNMSTGIFMYTSLRAIFGSNGTVSGSRYPPALMV